MILSEGTRIFNHGDMANQGHFGTIIAVQESRFDPTQYQIQADPDSDRPTPYWVFSSAFSTEYKGNGLTRFVTETAYRTWRASKIAAIKEKVAHE